MVCTDEDDVVSLLDKTIDGKGCTSSVDKDADAVDVVAESGVSIILDGNDAADSSLLFVVRVFSALRKAARRTAWNPSACDDSAVPSIARSSKLMCVCGFVDRHIRHEQFCVIPPRVDWASVALHLTCVA